MSPSAAREHRVRLTADTYIRDKIDWLTEHEACRARPQPYSRHRLHHRRPRDRIYEGRSLSIVSTAIFIWGTS